MIYPYESCCGKVRERVCRLAEYEADPSWYCSDCGQQLKRVITAPRALNNTREFVPFISPVDRTLITSQRALREHNKRNNVVNLHDGYDDKAVQNMTKVDYQKPLDAERRVDLASDMRQAVQKLEEGYKPTPAQEGEEL